MQTVMDCTEAWVIEHNSDGPLFQCPWFLNYFPIYFLHIQKRIHYRALILGPNQFYNIYIIKYIIYLKFIANKKSSLRVYRDPIT